MGASAPRTPGKGKDRANIPAVYWPTGGTGLCRRVAGTGGGGLWSANHPQTVFSDRPLRREAHCVAGTHLRAGGQPGGAGGAEKAVAERGGDHRLESPLPLHFRHAGGNPGEIRPFRPAATPAQYHAPGGQRRGQVRDQIRCPVYRTNGLRGAERTSPTSSQYRRPSAHGGGERQAWSLRPGHGAMDGDKHNQLHGAPRQ